jgi:hypothetical protein
MHPSKTESHIATYVLTVVDAAGLAKKFSFPIPGRDWPQATQGLATPGRRQGGRGGGVDNPYSLYRLCLVNIFPFVLAGG